MARPNIDEYFLQMAKLISTRATCLRRSVGCILVDKLNHVLSTGYNGVARGLPHCNEPTEIFLDGTPRIYGNACSGATAPSGTKLDECGAIHAEQNALLQCKNVQEIVTAYITITPCIHCVKLLMNTSCIRLVVPPGAPYDPLAMDLWAKAGREVITVDVGS